ncbi:hypothetical protein [Actinoallomurus sp. CA-150999]|uniref:hypothetical protein n=1 Tax=Actinoallomurus sp. CA-150999 TaxID=3239887 RepID=UPI003D8DE689
MFGGMYITEDLRFDRAVFKSNGLDDTRGGSMTLTVIGPFEGMPKSLTKDLAKNYPDFKKKFSQAVEVFGRVVGYCG